MVRRANPDFRRLGLVSALIAAMPGLLLAQDRVLPPPSLYSAAPPSGSAATDVVIAAPRAPSAPASAPATSAEMPSSAATAPAPAPAAAAQRQVEPAPASAPVAGTADGEQPWYKRAWSTVTGWFGGGDSAAPAPAQKDATMVAVAPSSTSAPVTLSSPPAPVQGGRNPGYAMDSPDRTVRTGVLGQCVKTGIWEPSDMTAGCGAGPKMAKVEEPAAMTRAAEPRVEAVEVKPLATPVLKEEKSLEVEPPVAVPALAPEPEPAPVPAPVAKPQPQLTTLSADALFALGSYQLKPAAKDSLDDFAAQLKSLDYQHIKIVGHTDPTGTVKFNDKLSRQRADAVKRYLVSRGVPGDRIEAEGVGSAMPMVIETDCARLPRAKMVACYQPDRRVDIEVHGASSRVARQ